MLKCKNNCSYNYLIKETIKYFLNLVYNFLINLKKNIYTLIKVTNFKNVHSNVLQKVKKKHINKT